MRSILRYAILPGMFFPVLASAFTPISLSPGWNLVGNSDPTPIDVTTMLSGSQITTVWKWNKVAGKWAFYAPSMTSAQLATYAQGKGYDVLTSINSKEGFWVNAGVATVISDPLAPPPAVGTSVSLAAGDLAQGWNLMGSSDKKTPSQLHSGLSSSLNAASKAISTLWAWDSASTSWRFFAPSLESQGGTVLSNYITSKNYLPFTSVLAATDGFWVNIGAATPIVNPPSPSGSLRNLNFNSANDWSLRVMSGTAAMNTPAADGSTRYRELRMAKVGGGAPYSWGFGSSPNRGADVHWSGTSWSICPINHENVSNAADANGNFGYNYCNGYEIGTGVGTTSTKVDVSGRPMIDVYNEIQTAGNTNLTITSAATVLGAATFPTGSKVDYRTNGSDYTSAVAYYPGISNIVWLTDTNVAAGISTACNANPALPESPNATLEQLIAVNKGTPCVYGVVTAAGANGVALTSGTRNEGWDGTSLSLGTLGNAPTYPNLTDAPSFYTTNTRLRVAFGTGNVANYYSCKESWNGSARNCDLIGTGTFTIQTLGDGRTLSFSGLPSIAAPLGWTRVLVERGGLTYYGYQNMSVASAPQARLNLTGLNALFSTLGLPAFNPDTPITLTQGSYAGTYSGISIGTDTGIFTTSISSSGATTCSGLSMAGGAYNCSFTLTPTAANSTRADISMGITGTNASFTGTVDFYTGAVNGTWVNGVNSGTFTGSRE